MLKPKMIIAGANKGGTGKTTVTRILSDYLKAKQSPTKYYDTEWPQGDLKRFIKDARVLDISKVTSQMEVFDKIEPETTVVMDLRAGMLTEVLEELYSAGFFDDVHNGKMNLILLHVVGPTISSLQDVLQAAEKVGGGAIHYIVKNHINESTFFEWDTDNETSPFRAMSDLTITIPQLTERAMEVIQKQACSFADFATDQTQSRILRGHVFQWIKKVFAEFDRIDLSKREDYH